MNSHIIVVYFSLKEESCSPAMVLIWSSTHIRLHIWLMLKLRSDRWTQYVWRGLFFQYAHYYTKEKRQMEANHWINENSLFIPSSKNWFNDTTRNLSLKVILSWLLRLLISFTNIWHSNILRYMKHINCQIVYCLHYALFLYSYQFNMYQTIYDRNMCKFFATSNII